MIDKLVSCLILLVWTSATYASEPNFEIYNKDKQAISVDVSVEFGELSPDIQKTKIDSNRTLQSVLSISNKDQAQLTIRIGRLDQEFIFKIKPGDKKILVSFDAESKKEKLYPQTGPLKGIFRKTKSGLSLSNNIAKTDIQDISGTKATEDAHTAESAFDKLPDGVKKIALRLKESSDESARLLYHELLFNEAFQDQIGAIVMPESIDALIDKLLVLNSLDQIKKHFGVVFAGHWERMVSKGWIKIREWHAPASDKLHLFAKAFEKEIANPLVSSDVILKYLPGDFEKIDKIDRFTKSQEAQKLQPDTEIFSSVISNAPKSLELEVHLPEVLELVKYGMEFKGAGYPAGLIGKVIANVLANSKTLSNSIAKGSLFGWNISSSFKDSFQKELFGAFLADAGKLDFGQTQLLMNFFQDMKFPVTKGDLLYASELGKFVKDAMAKGLSFSQINIAVRRNLKFNQKTSAQDAKNLTNALMAIEITTPKVDGEKVFKNLRARPFYAVGSVLEKFVADLLPEKEKSKASTIKDGLKELDAHASEIKAVSQMRKILDENQILIVSLLPTALNDTALAAQNLLQSGLNTINARINNKRASSELGQLNDLVDWIVVQARLLRTEPESSIFYEMPLSLKEQSTIKLGLGKIRLLGALDTYLGKKIIEKFLARSEALREQLPPESRTKVSKLIAPIASAIAGALPAIVKKFSVEKYLDFLVQVGEFKAGRASEQEFRKEVWKCLKVLGTDLTSVSDTLPRALEAIRDLGSETGP